MARGERGCIGGEEDRDVELDELVSAACEEIDDASFDGEPRAARDGGVVLDGARPGVSGLRDRRRDESRVDEWLPEAVLLVFGVGIFKTDEPFVTADGRRVKRDVGVALVRHGPFKMVDEVVIGKTGDLALLGACTPDFVARFLDRLRDRVVGPHAPSPGPR